MFQIFSGDFDVQTGLRMEEGRHSNVGPTAIVTFTRIFGLEFESHKLLICLALEESPSTYDMAFLW